MKHVLRGERHLDRRPYRHVQLVDLVLAVEVLELPHPPLGGGVNLERLVGRALQVEEHVCGPGEDHDRDEERNDRPGQLERNRPVNALADREWIACVVFRREEDHQDGDEHSEERRDGDDEEIQVVHA